MAVIATFELRNSHLGGVIRTFAQSDAKCEVLDKVPSTWQVNQERGGLRLAYEPRNTGTGRSLYLLGELHMIDMAGVDGTYTAPVLVKYDADMRERLDDWWVPRDQSWFPLTVSDKDAAWMRLRTVRDVYLKEHPEHKKLERLLARVARGSKGARLALCSLCQEQLDAYRDVVLRFQMGTQYLMYTNPRVVKKIRKELGI